MAGGVGEVDHPQRGEAIDIGLEVRAATDFARLDAKRPLEALTAATEHRCYRLDGVVSADVYETPAMDEARAVGRTTRPRLLPPGEAEAGPPASEMRLCQGGSEERLPGCASRRPDRPRWCITTAARRPVETKASCSGPITTIEQLAAVLRVAELIEGERRGLTWETVELIRASERSAVSLAHELGVSDTLIRRVRRGELWTTAPERRSGALARSG
jgi:hypothetical protein